MTKDEIKEQRAKLMQRMRDLKLEMEDIQHDLKHLQNKCRDHKYIRGGYVCIYCGYDRE